jgi:hypothetical protein
MLLNRWVGPTTTGYETRPQEREATQTLLPCLPRFVRVSVRLRSTPSVIVPVGLGGMLPSGGASKASFVSRCCVMLSTATPPVLT